MAAYYSRVIFTSSPSCVNVWGSDGAQLCAYRDAIVKVTVSPDSSQFFLWAKEGTSFVASRIDSLSFRRVIKVNGTTVALCNSLGGVCISFENETTLKDFAKSLRSALPAMAVVVDLKEPVDTDTASTSADLMDSFLSELSATLSDDLSDLLVDDDDDVAADLLDWDVVDF